MKTQQHGCVCVCKCWWWPNMTGFFFLPLVRNFPKNLDEDGDDLRYAQQWPISFQIKQIFISHVPEDLFWGARHTHLFTNTHITDTAMVVTCCFKKKKKLKKKTLRGESLLQRVGGTDFLKAFGRYSNPPPHPSHSNFPFSGAKKKNRKHFHQFILQQKKRRNIKRRRLEARTKGLVSA